MSKYPIVQAGDNELIGLLLVSEPWKAMDRILQQMEADSFESLLHGAPGEVVAAEVQIIRKIRRLPENARTATG